jgi:HSP20 family protein
MALIRWQPFQEVETLHRQMNQMFDELMASERQSATSWQPAIELQDTEDNLVLRLEIPGVDGKDIDIHVTREAVAISGEHRFEKKTQEKGFFRSEFRYGKFQRVIPLPVPIQNDQVKADFKNGVLTLTMPKVTEARRTVIKLNLADSTDNATKELNAQAATKPTNVTMN